MTEPGHQERQGELEHDAIVGSLADVGARYTYELFGWEAVAESKNAVIVLAVTASS